MSFVNYNNKEITVKIVYYGPALSGKTTCLRSIYGSDSITTKGKLITLDTDGDRTLFFDFLPLEIGKLGNYSLKIQLYTVPGQVAYDTTRKLVLQGSDGIVFVADSQVIMREQNIDSLQNLKKNLLLNNMSYEDIPVIFHFNKRDLKEILPLDSLNKDLNQQNKPFFPTIALDGENVLEGLHTIIKLAILNLKNKLTIFQKDKTVMFSRDDLSHTPAPGKKEAPPTVQEAFPAAEEELFELSSPLIEENGIAPKTTEKDEDLFQLEDEIYPAETDGELTAAKPKQPAKSNNTAEEAHLSFDTPAPYSSPNRGKDQEEIEIPLTINLAGNQKEIRINLSIKIQIERD